MKVYRSEERIVEDNGMSRLGRAFRAIAIEVESVIFDVKHSKNPGKAVVQGVESILGETYRQIKKFLLKIREMKQRVLKP